MASDTNVGLGSRLLAIEIAIRVLIDRTSSTDATVRDRITAEVEAYLANLVVEISSYGDIEREFTIKAREAVAFLTRPPSP